MPFALLTENTSLKIVKVWKPKWMASLEHLIHNFMSSTVSPLPTNILLTGKKGKEIICV